MKGDRFQIFMTDNLDRQFLDFADDGHWALCEVLDDKVLRIVGVDGGEPEDQIFIRDWQWVVKEMNRLYALYEEAHKQAVAFATGSEALHQERLDVLEKLKAQRVVTFDLLNTGCPFRGENEYTDARWCAIDKTVGCQCDLTLELPKLCPLREGAVVVEFKEKENGGENKPDGS